LQAGIAGLQSSLRFKDDILRMKDEQLDQWAVRDKFNQDELRSVQLLAAPLAGATKAAPARKKWLGIF
jgi:hypothetical protein